jgi:hypothetical protein
MKLSAAAAWREVPADDPDGADEAEPPAFADGPPELPDPDELQAASRKSPASATGA